MGRGTSASGQVTADAELFLRRGGGALSPLGGLGNGPGAGDDCAGADQQQADQWIPPPSTRTWVGYALAVGVKAAGAMPARRPRLGAPGQWPGSRGFARCIGREQPGHGRAGEEAVPHGARTKPSSPSRRCPPRSSSGRRACYDGPLRSTCEAPLWILLWPPGARHGLRPSLAPSRRSRFVGRRDVRPGCGSAHMTLSAARRASSTVRSTPAARRLSDLGVPRRALETAQPDRYTYYGDIAVRVR